MSIPPDDNWHIPLETATVTVCERPDHYRIQCRMNGATTVEFDLPKLGYNVTAGDLRLALSVIERIEDGR